MARTFEFVVHLSFGKMQHRDSQWPDHYYYQYHYSWNWNNTISLHHCHYHKSLSYNHCHYQCHSLSLSVSLPLSLSLCCVVWISYMNSMDQFAAWFRIYANVVESNLRFPLIIQILNNFIQRYSDSNIRRMSYAWHDMTWRTFGTLDPLDESFSFFLWQLRRRIGEKEE